LPACDGSYYSGDAAKVSIRIIMDPALTRELKILLGPDSVLSDELDLMLYEFDGSCDIQVNDSRLNNGAAVSQV